MQQAIFKCHNFGSALYKYYIFAHNNQNAMRKFMNFSKLKLTAITINDDM